MIFGPVSRAETAQLPDAETVLATRGRSFYWARHLLGARHAKRATRLYGFCRYVDDLADEARSPQQALQALDACAHAIRHRHAINALVADMLALMQECAIDTAIVLELIRGVRSDLGVVRYADESSLLRYCYRVAGTVGLMMCHVLDVDDAAAWRHAIDLGIGMQLTNICRDVSEDAVLGRRYLPASLVGDCAPSALQQPDVDLQPAARQAVETLLARAEAYYLSGESGLHYLPAGARAAMLVAARLYRAIGRRLQRRDHAYWRQRVVISSPVKMALTLQALFDLGMRGGVVGSNSAHRYGLDRHVGRPIHGRVTHRPHDPLLHLPLTGLPFTVFSGTTFNNEDQCVD